MGMCGLLSSALCFWVVNPLLKAPGSLLGVGWLPCSLLLAVFCRQGGVDRSRTRSWLDPHNQFSS